MTLIGIDDTDSNKGMCTTYLMAQFMQRARASGWDVIGYPRLVRLNPNIPYKTRGNGALCVELGRGTGKPIVIGRWDDEEIQGFPKAAPGEEQAGSGENVHQLISLACEIVEEFAELDAPGTDPGVTVFEQRPWGGNAYYRKAVQNILTMDDAEQFVRDHNGLINTFNSGRGIIGAAAACAWGPGDRTYEIISYRHPSLFGTERHIDRESVIEMDRRFPSTFNNYDQTNDHIAIVPSSPCPVLHAIRGEDPMELVEAAGMIRGEQPEGWITFVTNQGTDDHLRTKRIREIGPCQSVIAGGIVRKGPRELPGGHVVVSIDDRTGTIDCMAYEPTKEFRRVVRQLTPDDGIIACGGIREKPFSINLEKIKIIALTERRRKVSNPVCPECGKGMKSIGTGQGYRCRKCGRKAREGDEGVYESYEPGIELGWYEVPVCARRHLHKPLKRF